MNDDQNFTLSVATAHWFATSRIFDDLIVQLQPARLSFEEGPVLAPLRDLGEEISLRDDVRFRQTPAGRWILATSYLANDALYHQLLQLSGGACNFDLLLSVLDQQLGKHAVFCPVDPRFALVADSLLLAEVELTDEPLIREQVGVEEQYLTHLPLLRLRQAAYRGHQLLPGDDILGLDEAPPGWIRVELSIPLDRRMFVARIEDDSMNDGVSGVRKCDYAVFTYQQEGVVPDDLLLVRGTFDLSGTGFYCIRRVEYENDLTLLRPLHSDWVRYPSISLNLAEGDTLIIVARLIEVLTPAVFERQPRQRFPLQHRPINDCRYQEQLAERFAARMRRFFAPEPNAVTPSPTLWKTTPICLAADAGGLQLEIGPLSGFWSDIRQLRLVGDGWEKICVTTSLRQHTHRVALAPWTESLRWEAVGFEEDEAIDLSPLDLPGLPADKVTVFSVDADGIGHLNRGRSLQVGQRYRLLIPPAVLTAKLTHLDQPPPLTIIAADWHLWELKIPPRAGSELVAQLRSIGLTIANEAFMLDWVIVPPVDWSRNRKGLQYPEFLAESGLVLRVTSPLLENDSEAILLLHAATGPQIFQLPAGREQLLRLDNLRPGKYGVLIVHQRTDVRVASRFFEVVESAPDAPAARCLIGIDGEWHNLIAGETLTLPDRDLRRLDHLPGHLGSHFGEKPHGERARLELEAPPGWPVNIFWKSITTERLIETHADRKGRLDSSLLCDLMRHRLEASQAGELIFDLRELGRVILPHQRELDIEAIREAMTELVINLAPTVRRHRGEYLMTIPLWFTPVLSLLGYTIEDCTVTTPEDDLRVMKLFHEERTSTGYTKRLARLLFLSPALTTELEKDRLDWMDRVAAEQQVYETILSDGLNWAVRRRRSRLPLKVRDLEWIVDELDVFIDFLRESGEGL